MQIDAVRHSKENRQIAKNVYVWAVTLPLMFRWKLGFHHKGECEGFEKGPHNIGCLLATGDGREYNWRNSALQNLVHTLFKHTWTS